MGEEPERSRSWSVPVGERGVVKAWYEETKSSIAGRTPSITVGAEITVAIEDVEQAKDILAETVRDIPVRVRAAIPRTQREEVTSSPEDMDAGTARKRPHAMPRSRGRTGN